MLNGPAYVAVRFGAGKAVEENQIEAIGQQLATVTSIETATLHFVRM
jgi:hypothetical protein